MEYIIRVRGRRHDSYVKWSHVAALEVDMQNSSISALTSGGKSFYLFRQADLAEKDKNNGLAIAGKAMTRLGEELTETHTPQSYLLRAVFNELLNKIEKKVTTCKDDGLIEVDDIYKNALKALKHLQPQK
ncbi:MAG TPA: hypothetical protein VK445_00170 [Dissulfurispiraceae bacterium]|nr:hypothetical protein [Dissulfurispiraceae bacterium]